jgi:hypothetical protein
VAVQILLDAAQALVERVAGETDHMKGMHDHDRVGQLLGGGGLELGEVVHRDHLEQVTPGLGTFGEPGLEDRFERPSTMSSSRDGPVPSRIGVSR